MSQKTKRNSPLNEEAVEIISAVATANRVKSRGWCVTINNPTDDDFNNFHKLEAQYKCYKVEHTEIGAGTPHIQGYVYFKNARYFKGIRKALPRAHLEAAKGTTAQNKKYCSKEGSLDYEDGEEEASKKKIAESLSMTNEEIRTTWPLWADRLIANKNKVNESKHQGYNENKNVLYITGESGWGKTKLAREIAGPDADIIQCSNNFVNGYSNEEKNVIWDEFRDSHCKLSDFLQITDKYNNRINTKNGSALFYTNLLVITSIIHPNDLYKNCEESRVQISRRLDILDLNLEENAKYRFLGDKEEQEQNIAEKYGLEKINEKQERKTKREKTNKIIRNKTD